MIDDSATGPAGQPAGEQAEAPVRGSTEQPTAPVERRPAARAAVLRGTHADNSTAPTERQLPSGAVITTLRVSVARARTVMTSGSGQGVDWVDCTAWSARSRRSVSSWQVGDAVEVTGALRRRFFRAGGGSSTRLEVEVISAKRVPPSGSG